jgi:predicted TPR repeat methyltransferase
MEKLQTTASADFLTSRLASLIDAGRLDAARPLLAAVRRLEPSSQRLMMLSARLSMREKRFDLARTELDEGVTRWPEHAGLRKFRADLRMQLDDPEGAAADAAEAVILDGRDPAAKALLGILMLELKRPVDAIACLAEAVAAEPANPAYCEGLAAAQEATGNADAALATLIAGIAAAPAHVKLRNAAVLVSVRRRDFNMAVKLAEEGRIAGVADACLFGLKGHALSSLGRHAEAIESYAEALKLGPDDAYVRHLVAAAGVVPGEERAPAEYLRAVFDGYAERFDLHLISLGYRVPGLIRAGLTGHPAILAGEHIGPVLDLGCGTGLVAVAVSDLPIGPIIGVDVSPRMLASAAAKQLYAELREADLMNLLTEDVTCWPLIIAADVFCFFGALREVLAAVHARLEPGGWIMFTVEELLADHDGAIHGNADWSLQRQGRYAHAMSYVASVAKDLHLTIRVLEREALRYEADVPVAGIFAFLERTRHDG